MLQDFRERHYSEQQLQEKLKSRGQGCQPQPPPLPVELPKLDMGQISKNDQVAAVHSAPPTFPPSQLMFRSIAEEKEPSYQSEENDEFHVSSNESLHELQHIARKRTISGNYSERSTSSSREVTYIRSIHDHQHIGTESKLLLTAGAGQAPFVVTSVIPWQKTHYRHHTNRYPYNIPTSTFCFTIFVAFAQDIKKLISLSLSKLYFWHLSNTPWYRNFWYLYNYRLLPFFCSFSFFSRLIMHVFSDDTHCQG